MRFADALPLSSAEFEPMNPVTLKILSTPKPPSPGMYFHPRNHPGAYVAKMVLTKDKHLPNGRKVYLHHPPSGIQNTPWVTGDPNERTDQKLRCIPVGANHDFYFHIDFDNLSNAELSLLLTSLRPAERFRHRLGLGKSLGLGSVRIDVEAVLFIDRLARYGRNALTEPRYQKVWKNQKGSDELPWGELYPDEAHRMEGKIMASSLQQSSFFDPALIDTGTLDLLSAVGDPGKLKPNTPVQAPLLDNQLTGVPAEQETFKWFVENDKQHHPQALQPVRPNRTLPMLTTYPPPTRRQR